LPLELQGLTTSVTTPVIYALGTMTTLISLLVMIGGLLIARSIARKRASVR
jgi:putative spermidine/putrescine transport system permease protein